MRISPDYNLFPYQREVSRQALACLSGSERYSGERKCVVHMPTGGGKTRTAMSVVCRVLTDSPPGSVVIWFASTKELCEQAHAEFCRAWSKMGTFEIDAHEFFSDNSCEVSEVSGFLVAGLAKMNSVLYRDPGSVAILTDRVCLVVFDEAHMAVAPGYRETTEFVCTMGASLLGLSATPGRTSDLGPEDEKLPEMFGHNLIQMQSRGYESPITYLIEEGYLARPAFIQLDYGDIEESVSVDDGEYQEKIGGDEGRNRRICQDLKFALAKHERVVTFCPCLKSVGQVCDFARVEGLDVYPVWGDMPKDERESVLKKYLGDSREHIAIVNCGVLTTGFDAPRTSCVIIARPTRSLVLYSQMVGRALRGPKAGGNRSADIYTIVCNDDPAFSSPEAAFMKWDPLWGVGA